MANAKVQTAGGSVAGSLAKTRSFPIAVTSGNLLTVFVHTADATATLTVTDSQGSYSQAGSYTTGTGGAVSWWYRTATATGGNVVQVLSNINTNISVEVGEWSSIYGFTFNASAGGTGTSAAPSTGLITAAAGDLVLAGWGSTSVAGNVNNVASSPFTGLTGNGVSGTVAQQAYDLTASGNVTGTFDSTSSVAWAARGASFTPNAAPATVPPVNIFRRNEPGPPMRGFPWTAPVQPALMPRGVAPPAPPPPVTPPASPPPPPGVPPVPPLPPVPTTTDLAPALLSPDEEAPVKVRRFMQQLSDLNNSLVTTGQLQLINGVYYVVTTTTGASGVLGGP